MPVTNGTTNLFFLLLDQKGESIERKVYSIWDLLADIGGFKDGLIMVFGGVFVTLDSNWFSIDLNKVVFRVAQTNKKRRNRKLESGIRQVQIRDGEQIIVPSTLANAVERWKRSVPYKARFFGLYCQCLGSREKRRERLY